MAFHHHGEQSSLPFLRREKKNTHGIGVNKLELKISMKV